MNITTCWVSSLEKVFPEQSLAGREFLCGSALRGERFNVQLAFRADDGLRDDFFVEWESDLKENIRCYQVQSVPVRLVKYKWADDDFLSDKPGLYPDLLEICSGRAEYSPGFWSCLWFEITVPENAVAVRYIKKRSRARMCGRDKLFIKCNSRRPAAAAAHTYRMVSL